MAVLPYALLLYNEHCAFSDSVSDTVPLFGVGNGDSVAKMGQMVMSNFAPVMPNFAVGTIGVSQRQRDHRAYMVGGGTMSGGYPVLPVCEHEVKTGSLDYSDEAENNVIQTLGTMSMICLPISDQSGARSKCLVFPKIQRMQGLTALGYAQAVELRVNFDQPSCAPLCPRRHRPCPSRRPL